MYFPIGKEVFRNEANFINWDSKPDTFSLLINSGIDTNEFTLNVNRVFIGSPGGVDPFVAYDPLSPDGRVGFNIGEGTLIFASIKANGTIIPGDDRSFTAVQANFTGDVGMVGMPDGIEVTASNIKVALNGASGTSPSTPTAINWLTSVNENGNSTDLGTFIHTDVLFTIPGPTAG